MQTSIKFIATDMVKVWHVYKKKLFTLQQKKINITIAIGVDLHIRNNTHSSIHGNIAECGSRQGGECMKKFHVQIHIMSFHQHNAA